MSSPVPPKSQSEEVAEPSSPTTTTAPETSMAQVEDTIADPRRPSRWADPSFGDRLANARNLPPIRAPPPPPAPPAVARSLGEGYEGELRGASSRVIPRQIVGPLNTATVPQIAFGQDKETQRWPREKGSYRNPYDYPITSGRALGAHDLPRAAQIPRGSVPGPAHVPNVPQQPMPGHGMLAAGPSSVLNSVPFGSKTKFVQPPAEAQDRFLLLGPLSLMRKECDKMLELKPLADFIDQHMAPQLHTVIERDSIIPNVIYMVSIPMTEEHWTMYNRFLAYFRFPLAFHQMLAGGRQDFDHIAGSNDPALPPTVKEANNMLTYGTISGMDLQAILRELVKANFHE